MAQAEIEQIQNFEAQLSAARQAFRLFLNSCRREEQIVVLHDSDADGVTAGVVLQRALERSGFESVQRVIPDRERNAWTEANRRRVREHNPHALFGLDLGASSEPVIENVSTCFIDHHRPEGIPPNATLISAYTWQRWMIPRITLLPSQPTSNA